MAKVITMRNFPEDLHRRIKVQAAKESITIKDLIINVLENTLKRRKDDFMGVTVRQKVKGKGKPWWVFVSHNGKRKSK